MVSITYDYTLWILIIFCRLCFVKITCSQKVNMEERALKQNTLIAEVVISPLFMYNYMDCHTK